MTSPPDSALTLQAQAGDIEALGVLLARHQAGMKAVALGILGYGQDADDAMQDAAVIALRRISDVRDPAAVGAWLRMIVRNCCRAHLRAVKQHTTVDEPMAVSDDFEPERVIEQSALRDWIWQAVDDLAPPLQMAVMLRYFSSVTSYDQIAALCEVPVGTVRSRLSKAKAHLARSLTAVAERAHGDSGALTAARHHEGVQTLAAAERGAFAEVVADRWSPDVELSGGMGERGGRDLLLWAMDRDLNAGIRQRVAHTVASRDLTIWENDLISPPDDPEHCPPSVIWLLSMHQDRVRHLRLFFPVPPRRYLGVPVRV